MPLILKGLTSCLNTFGGAKAVNDNIIKPFVLDINATRKRLVYYHEIILRRHQPCFNNIHIDTYLFSIHWLVFIIKRMKLDCIEASISCCRNNTLIGFDIGRVTPIPTPRLRPQLIYVVNYICKVDILCHSIASF